MTDNQYIKPTSIDGLYIIERPTFTDERGYFREVFHLNELEEAIGYNFTTVQMNHSVSVPRVIRGFHPDPWDKLVYPVTGDVFIAIADVDPESPTFKRVETFRVNDENRTALFIKKGLGNSICVVGEEDVHYVYLVTSYWDGNAASGMRAVRFDDPDLGVDWPVKDPIISEKDQQNSTLKKLYQADYPELFK